MCVESLIKWKMERANSNPISSDLRYENVFEQISYQERTSQKVKTNLRDKSKGKGHVDCRLLKQ